MFSKQRLRAALACLLLQYGVLLGVPVRTADLDELQRALAGSKIVKAEDESGDAE